MYIPFFAAAMVACGVFATASFAQSVTLSGDLSTILAPDAKIEKLATGYSWTEGPLYDKRTDSVLFSDQPSSTLNRYDCKTGKASVFRNDDVVPNGNTWDAEGRLVGCEHKTRRISRTENDGRIVTLAYLYKLKRFNSPNDIVIKSDGAIYFTDPPYGLPNMVDGKELSENAVYRIDTLGNVTEIANELTMPNGLAFSPDESILYIDDTQQKNIRAYDVRPDGSLANGRIFATLDGPGRGAPDGMKVDTHGNIYCTGPGGIWVLAPSGKVYGVIAMPENVANMAFGDKDAKTLYITASSSLYRIRLATPGKLPGKR